MSLKKQTTAILPETFAEIATSWLYGIHRGDITAVVSYPASDRQRRLLNLIDSFEIDAQSLPDRKQYIWITVDFRVEPIDDAIDLENNILNKLRSISHKKWPQSADFKQLIKHLEKSTHKKVAIAALGCENLIYKKRSSILIWFTKMRREDVLRQLLFFETNLLSKEVAELFGSVPAFQPRIKIMKLYDKANVEQFIKYLENKWFISINHKLKDQIIQQCGGMFLLIKEAVCLIRDLPDATSQQILERPEMVMNLASFWNGFSPTDKETLTAIIRKRALTQDQQSSIQYLIDTGIVEKIRSGHKITIPLFAHYIKRISSSHDKQLRLENHRILVDTTPVDAYFTKIEQKIMEFLLSKLNALVTRDQIAQIIWQKDAHEKYSDWAIDSHISRIRRKINQIGLNGNMLETIKGKGVIIHLSE